MTELSIVIPAKNEAANIGKLLDSILAQDYPKIADTPVFVALANSTDTTREIVLSYMDRLHIQVIPGGLPAIGRNAGARQTDSQYILFMDADVILSYPSTIRRAVELANTKNLDCVGTYLDCPTGAWGDRALYAWANFLQRLSQYTTPAAVGTFMLFRRTAFEKHGGFDEKITFGEDFFLSKKTPRSKFGMLPVKVLTGNRQFNRGYLRVMKLNFLLFLYRNNPQYFYRDVGYWH